MSVTVLIVDDDLQFARNLAQGLNLDGFKADFVGCGEDAITFLRDRQPQVLICDLKLPDFDGDEVIRRAKEISPKTIAFTISAYVDSAIEEKLKKFGVKDFMHKPVAFDEVTQMITKALPNEISE